MVPMTKLNTYLKCSKSTANYNYDPFNCTAIHVQFPGNPAPVFSCLQ